jgi:hypothetical protein
MSFGILAQASPVTCTRRVVATPGCNVSSPASPLPALKFHVYRVGPPASCSFSGQKYCGGSTYAYSVCNLKPVQKSFLSIINMVVFQNKKLTSCDLKDRPIILLFQVIRLFK